MSFDIKEYFTEIANAIRNKKGTTKKISAKNFASEIESINTSSVPEGYLKPEGKIYISNTNETDVSKYATAQVFDSNLKAENIKKDAYVLGITGTYDNSIKGITQGSGQYGSNDINIDGNTITTTGITIDSYSGGIAVSNSTEDNERINLKVQGNVDIQIEDASINNIITANNLLPENIKAGVEILGTVGTLSGTGSGVNLHKLDFEKNYAITVNETEIQTYSYQLTEEQKSKLYNLIFSQEKINGLGASATIYIGGNDYIQFFLNGSYGASGDSEIFNVTDYAINNMIFEFGVTKENIIYLSQAISENTNMIDQFIEMFQEVYIVIPTI